MIAEYEKQKYLFLIIPPKNSDFLGYHDKILQTYNHIISVSIKQQKICLITKTNNKLIRKYKKYKNIKIIYEQYNDIWARDILPIQTKNIKINFTFNGWGKKYPYTLDNRLGNKIFPKSKKNSIYLEGGAIESNGIIALMTYDTLYLNRNTNIDETKQELLSILNLNQIYILSNVNLSGDDTDGHIDNLARFVNKDTLMYLQDDSLLKMEDELIKIANKHNLNLIPLPSINTLYLGSKLPSSYLNFIQLNKIVLIPRFSNKLDDDVCSIFKKAFYNKKIIQIDSRYLVRQNGGLHCASYQEFKV